MKRSSYAKLTLCALLVLGVSSAWAFQMGVPQPFSADFSVKTKNGSTMGGKWFFSPPKMRMDMTQMPESAGRSPMGGNMSMIIDGSTQTSYMLMPAMQMYMEIHANSPQGHMNPGMSNLQNLTNGACPKDATCTKVGTEVVNGRSCDKYDVTDKTGKKSTVWVDQKLSFPVRVVGSDGSQTDFTNIKEGAQNASLFQVPPGYKPFDPAAFGGGQRPH